MLKKIINPLVAIFFLIACSKNSTSNSAPNVNTPQTNATVPSVYKKIYGATSITSDGTYITLKSNGLPDHKSAYYTLTNPLYDNFSGTTFGGFNFRKNPNSIAEKAYIFKIPVDPKVASNHLPTPLGAIGISLNGVPFFNQYAGPNQPLTNEMESFDRYWAHPSPSGQYHYHVEPIYLTTIKVAKSSLLGFLLDGFPVYGPEENGMLVDNSKLDAYHGHTAITIDYPAGIYHYHITSTDPYINGSGYYGSPGTVSQ